MCTESEHFQEGRNSFLSINTKSVLGLNLTTCSKDDPVENSTIKHHFHKGKARHRWNPAVNTNPHPICSAARSFTSPMRLLTALCCCLRFCTSVLVFLHTPCYTLVASSVSEPLRRLFLCMRRSRSPPPPPAPPLPPWFSRAHPQLVSTGINIYLPPLSSRNFPMRIPTTGRRTSRCYRYVYHF